MREGQKETHFDRRSEPKTQERCCTPFLLVVGLLHNCFVSGIIYGWPALARILTSEGQFSELCAAASTNTTNSSDIQDDMLFEKIVSCSASQLALTNCYVAGSTASLLSSLPFGIIIDKTGPKAASAIGTILSITGCILLAFAESKSFNVFAPALILIGFGGPGHHLSIFHLSNLVPKMKGLVIALAVSTFTVSGIIFVIFQVLVLNAGLSRSLVFISLAGILGVYLVLGLLLWPNKVFLPGDTVSARTFAADKYNPEYKGDCSHPFYSVVSAHDNEETEEGKLDGIAKAKIGRADLCGCGEFCKAFRTKDFLGITIFFVLSNFNYNFFMGTASQQLRLKGDNGDFLSLLAIILPAGVVFFPLISCTLDCFKYFGSFIMLTAIVVTGVIYMVVLLIPNLEVMVVLFVVLAFHRLALFSSTFSFIATTFDFKLYGRLTGVTILLSGVANLFSYVLLAITKESGSFFYVNVGLLCSVLCTTFFPIYVGCVACKKNNSAIHPHGWDLIRSKFHHPYQFWGITWDELRERRRERRRERSKSALESASAGSNSS